jgi:hypothetical protein
MGMSKKDYTKIAAALDSTAQSIRKTYEGNYLDLGTAWSVLMRLTSVIEDILAEDNPRFDREKFREATPYIWTPLN